MLARGYCQWAHNISKLLDKGLSMQIGDEDYKDEMTRIIPPSEHPLPGLPEHSFKWSIDEPEPIDYRLYIAIGCMIVGAIILILEGCK